MPRLAGQSAGSCENDVKSTTSGYQGTLGDDSAGSANIAQVPVAAPAEVYGLAAAVGGQAAGSADEVKFVRSSGNPNTADDNGTASSNIVTAPTAVAPQVFAVTAGLVGNTTSDTVNDTTVKAGDDPHATGKKGSVAGNIVQVPTSTPAQVFADGVTLVGNNKTVGDNATDMTAGGDALTTGEKGSIAGNVVSAPVATGTQVLGWSVGGGSNVDAFSANALSSVAGGDVNSNGDQGSVSGNLIGAQPAVFPAVPGNTVSAAGITNSDVVSDTNVVSGGDSYSKADDASVSGNLIHVPANAAAGVYADAVAAAGNATTVTDKTSHTQAGGEMLTEGSGPLTAREMTVPVEAAAKVARIPVEVVGQATTLGTSDDTQLTGEDAGTLRAAQLKGLELPKGVDSLLKANEVPAFHGLDSKLPVNQLPNPADLAALTGQLPTPALPAVAQERSALPVNGGTGGPHAERPGPAPRPGARRREGSRPGRRHRAFAAVPPGDRPGPAGPGAAARAPHRALAAHAARRRPGLPLGSEPEPDPGPGPEGRRARAAAAAVQRPGARLDRPGQPVPDGDRLAVSNTPGNTPQL